LIFSSSCTVYGDVQKVPVDENFPVQKPFSPYGKTKKVCEEMIEDVVALGALNCISLRYFNPIGAHTSLLLGDNPKNMDNIMPLILKVAKGEIKQLTVFGNDYDTKDGSCVRDYVHVMDIAAAHVSALERMLAKRMDKNLEFYNLGSEFGYSVFELIHTFEKVNGIKVNYQIAGRRKGDITQIYSNSALAKSKLNWAPKHTLEDMISSAWERDKKYVK
jgi:UDP-glucose 4-epimerase